ncbi:hypothetical protein [Achromobacter sp. DH1f]|uniref:hypothetical protein n=1 Tax=Achromobacter sp. DH1f TaxID=1397275 RepID=UPI000468BEB8|nr:hypothetical protein [Achromobacter sp. DH1f]
MPSSRALIGDDIRTSWREFAPVLIELARHNLPLVDRTWQSHPGWRLLRDGLVPMLLGTPYKFDVHRPGGYHHQGTLDPDLVPDANRCLNLLRAKIWQRLGRRCSVRKSEEMIEQIIRWLEHLTVACSMDLELIQMDFSTDLPEVGSVVHHNNRYGLVHASTAGTSSTLVSNMAATDRVAALVDDKFRALRDWLAAQPNGLADLTKRFSELAYELEELRFGGHPNHALPEYMSVSFSQYNGEVRTVVRQIRARKREPSPASQFDQQAVLASLHVRRSSLLVQRRQRGLAGALAAFAPHPQDGFDSVPVMAKRWRWLIHYPHAFTTLRSILESLPAKVYSEPRHMLEFINLQVDIAVLETNWDDGGEFADLLTEALATLDLDAATQQREADCNTWQDDQRASAWWLWFSVSGAPLWAKRTTACLDEAQQPLQAALSRARQQIASTGAHIDAVLDQILRENGHAPDRLFTPTKSDPFYSDMLKAFPPPNRLVDAPVMQPLLPELRRRQAASADA